MNEDARLRGQTALITGGSSGLGRATALALAGAGADVAVLARGAEELQVAVGQARALGVRASAHAVDLSDAAAIDRAVSQVLAELGPVDVLVNAAGTDAPGPVADLDVADWDRVLDVNLRASFLLAKAVWPGMRDRGGGTIVNVSSVAGRRGWANASAYCAAKFAVEGFMESLAPVAASAGVTVTVVEPGAVASSFVDNVGLDPRASPPNDPYASALAGYLARAAQSFSAAQSAESAGAFVAELLDGDRPPFRVQTTDAARAFVGVKLADTDGSAVQRMTTAWLD